MMHTHRNLGRSVLPGHCLWRIVVLLLEGAWLAAGFAVYRPSPPYPTEAAANGFLTYPFRWDEAMRLVAGWEYDDGDFHGAIDYVKSGSSNSAAWARFEVLAAAPGEACWKFGGGNDPGQAVVIRHDVDGVRYETRYIHLAAVGADIPHCPDHLPVARGAVIGMSGDRSWGRCRPPCVHLHFEVLRNDRPIDPYDLYGRSRRYPQPNGQVAGLMGPGHLWTSDPPSHPDEDETPPTIHFSLPRLNAWYNTDQRVAWTISDEGGSGIKGYNWAWDRDPGGMPPAFRQEQGSTSLQEAGAGIHMICVRAWDGRGNEVFLSQSWLGYDPFPPTRPQPARELHGAPNDVPQSEVNDPRFSWGEATDLISGIAGYEVYWGSNPAGAASNWTEAPAYDPGPVKPGVYYLRVRARDAAGNVSPWETLFTLRYE